MSGRDALLAVAGPVLESGGVSRGLITSRVTRRRTLTFVRCSVEQYHAVWQRLHHMEVGLQQTVQGWLMRGTGFMLVSGGDERGDYRGQEDCWRHWRFRPDMTGFKYFRQCSTPRSISKRTLGTVRACPAGVLQHFVLKAEISIHGGGVNVGPPTRHGWL